ncbi:MULTISPECIES: tetratricopeptide repeat protein [unclassified Sphingobacterium]|uniref:tetratricopeptide repeat protein n=1 Tax=unclassified Sphingobacterium TaxID=2609468 RepID=UPI0025CFF54D|nr:MULTISPECIES: hypothetical protein [unclassified Sphingobacterium]
MKNLLISFLISASSLTVVAQSNLKEGSNSFALYTKTGEFKNLENARKFADAAFQSRKDSASVNNNLLRALVYSSLAVADSTRKQQYKMDPIDISIKSLKLLDQKKARRNFPAEMDYIRQNLAGAISYQAGIALKDGKFDKAYKAYLRIDSLGFKNNDLKYNLAVLSGKNKDYMNSIKYYNELIKSEQPKPNYFLELAHIYSLGGTKQDVLNVLEKGHVAFPENKQILFRLIDVYSANHSYDAILNVIADAIRLEPENVELNYIAGYSYENANDIKKAKEYYNNVLRLDPNNYESNLALGLINLETLLKEPTNQDIQELTIEYLLKANEIKPYDVNALKALAKYYTLIDDASQLDRVNLLLNQLTVK